MLATTSREPFKRWFFEGTTAEAVGPHAKAAHTASWWRVMCPTGVDYFSEVLRQTEDDPQRRPRVHAG